MRLFTKESSHRSRPSEGADRWSLAASALEPGEALERALAEDRAQREARQTRFNRRVRAVWRIYGWMNWAFPLGVLGLAAGAVLGYVFSNPLLDLNDMFAPGALMLFVPGTLVSLLFGWEVWQGIRDWVGRALLSLFLDAARREEIGLIAPEAVTSEGI